MHTRIVRLRTLLALAVVPSTAPASRLPSDSTRRHVRARAPSAWLRKNAVLDSASASGVN